MSTAEDDRKLIQIVEYHQVLWDNRIKGFRDKNQTQHAWASVAEVLERNVSDVMARWASLRKQYGRKVCQLRQKTGLESPETTWHLFSYFSFLKPCITARKILPNIPQANHTSQQPTYTSVNNYTSTEDLSSSSMSDGGSPHLVRVNPADKTEAYQVTEKKQIRMIKSFSSPVSNTSTIKNTLRSFTNKSREQNKVSPITSTTKTSSVVVPTQLREQSDNESLSSSVAKVSRPNGPKSSVAVSKPQSVDVKPAMAKPSELNVKKLKMSADNVYSSSVSKVTNGVLDGCIRSKDYNSKACDFQEYDSKGCGSKSCDSKGCGSKGCGSKGCGSKGCGSKGCGSKGCDSKGCDSKGCGSKGYDADEYFLLSLAPDLRRLSPRQKYEVKSKMLDIVSEQFLMN